tara:strand:- start:3214 stop:5448 length:2235 start_codon:yes stop_codon:yes gene_type:complete
MRQQIKSLGLSYNWEAELATCRDDYYKHEQKIFLEFLEQKIAYRKESYVNWDPVDNTVLANEQVIDGKGWRSGAIVERKKLNGWFLRVSDYADELLKEIDNLKDWPNSVKNMQQKWLGKSEGAIINFEIENYNQKLKVYTTRPETIFGASFCAIAPQHPIALELAKEDKDLKEFIEEANKVATSQEAIDRTEKLGFKTKLEIKHPFIKNKKLPLYVANFILLEYGSGAVFACPAHDQRDYDFAKKYDLDIKYVVENPKSKDLDDSKAFTGHGKMINSDFLNSLNASEAKEKIINKLEELSLGQRKVNFKIRDWGVSRQRYWGCPIPIIYCNDCGAVPVPKEDLPVKLPEKVDFSKAGNPLANHPSWKHVDCPKCGKKAERETDTFDTFFESSWYFLRFLDSKNKDHAFDKDLADKYLGVDCYIGGIEHAVLHLLYARFFTKALADIGYLTKREPFKQLITQGMVTNMSFKDEDGGWLDVSNIAKEGDKYINLENKSVAYPQRIEKMSKSKKNGVNPQEIISTYGADTARLFMLSDSPVEKDLEWSDSGLEGAWKYLNKIWKFVHNFKNKYPEIKDFKYGQESNREQKALLISLNQQIDNIGKNFSQINLNKAIANIRELSNSIFSYKIKNNLDAEIINFCLKHFAILISPAIPHFSAEISNILNINLEEQTWPKINKDYLEKNSFILALQINGKLRATIELDKNISATDQENAALDHEAIRSRLEGKEIKKIINIPGKIFNVVI